MDDVIERVPNMPEVNHCGDDEHRLERACVSFHMQRDIHVCIRSFIYWSCVDLVLILCG